MKPPSPTLTDTSAGTTQSRFGERTRLPLRCAQWRTCALAALMFALVFTARADVRYVDVQSANPTPPYTNWATAARVIQDAVDAAVAGDEIVVTNGTYAIGGRAVEGGATNRVAVTKRLRLRSVNGAEFTVIEGERMMRCVYLADGVGLSGFTLTNGLADGGGGALCVSTNASISGCALAGNSGSEGGGVWGGTLDNCTLTRNSADLGGGAAASMLNNCRLSTNSAIQGGGAYNSTLINCTLTANSARWAGGGAHYSTLINCTLTANSADSAGGGAYVSTLVNCAIIRNSADLGGGAVGRILNNCTISGNSARWGGGVDGGIYEHGTIGITTLNNCIVYGNTAESGDNYSPYTKLNFCCTAPLPAAGTGNITLDPQLTDAAHIGARSPCRGAGSSSYATGADLDGEPWANPPSIGCDEYHAGGVSGPINVHLEAAFTSFAVRFRAEFVASLEGRAAENVWDFGDGVLLTNQLAAAHAWAAPGDYILTFRAYNDDHSDGVLARTSVHVVAQPVHYVSVRSTNPRPPYASWDTAATNIQDAVDAASVAGALITVTNGVYATGGRITDEDNRVAVSLPLELRSVNGPEHTVIDGGGLVRCADLTNSTSLSGFMLINGASTTAGGLWCRSDSVTVSDCILANNSGGAHGGAVYGGTLNRCTLSGNTAGWGGGAFRSTLNHCTLTNNVGYGGGGGAWNSALNDCALIINSTDNFGGGARYGTLKNCRLIGNSAGEGGGGASATTLVDCVLTHNTAGTGAGAYGGTLNNCTLSGNVATASCGGASSGFDGLVVLSNCILYGNSAPSQPNYNNQDDGVTLSYCCTTPLPVSGVGNIATDPRFVNAAAGDLRLRPDSPCIDAGTNLLPVLTTDLDGLPRPLDGNGDGVAQFDIGAYEFNPYRFGATLHFDSSGFALTVNGEPGKTARVERSRDLMHWELVASVVLPANGQSVVDAVAKTEAALFYRAVLVP